MESLTGYPKFNVPKKKKSLTEILNGIKNSGYSKAQVKRNPSAVITKKGPTVAKTAVNVSKKIKPKKKTKQKNTGGSSSESSSGSGVTTGEDASLDSLSGGGDSDTSSSGDSSGSSDSSSSGATSPLLEGSMSFEELVGEICNGIDLIFAVKRSTVVITDYESIYAEAKYLRDNYHSSVQAEDVALWQLEDGSYELEVNEYGFYNTVVVHYKNGTVTESYEDLVRVFGVVKIDYYEKTLDKTSAIYKAKAYLAAHIRDFDMSVKANLLHDADIDIGDIVTLDNPQTMRDSYRKNWEKRDPEYLFVTGNSISWDGEGPIMNSIELRYGAKSPEKKEVPEVGAGSGVSSDSSSYNGDVKTALDEVGKKWSGMKYSHACQTYECVQKTGGGDCWGCSDTLSCELEQRGVKTKILEYPTSASSQHRSVQYLDGSEWKNFPYRKYGFNSSFNSTGGVSKGKEVKGSCQ